MSVTPKIRRATPDDADFIAWTILAAQRGHRPRGWFDIALDWPEQLSRAFVRRIALAQSRSWGHTSHFLIAEGHEDIEIEQVIAKRDGYVVVEKDGAAGIVADNDDPRS